MALHVYRKEQNTPVKRVARGLSYLSLVVGAFLLFWAYYPIISFEIYSRLFINQIVTSPVPSTNVATSLEAAQSVYGNYDVFSSNLRDFLQANVWFPNSAKQVMAAERITVKEYKLSIPKLNIIDAKVIVGGQDLAKGIIHYLPTSLPGDYGTVALFGHSSLPQLYNVKDYKTIFTYLPSLDKGDKIVVTLEGKKYEYEVKEMFIVNPDQISILEPQLDASYLIVVTCVPPGKVDKRLVVKAKLTKLPD